MNLSSTQNRFPSNIQQQGQSNLDQRSSVKPARLLSIFRFAKISDIIYMVLGGLCSLLIGGALPLFSLLWGNMTNSFKNSEEMVNKAFFIFIQYLAFGGIAIFAGWGQQHFWNVASQNQVNSCRKAFLESLMRQDMGFFETQQSTQIIAQFVGDSRAFQLAIGEKIGLVIYLISMFTSGLAISIRTGWELTLVVLAFEPLLIFSFWFIMHNQRKRSENEEEIYQEASSIAQEAVQSIKIVKKLNGQDHQFRRFQAKIDQINEKAFSFNMKMSLGQALCLFSLLFAFALAFWYGSQCVQSTSFCPQASPNPYSGGSILTIFFCLLMPAVNLNQFTPTLKTIAEGRQAALRLFTVIDRQPTIKSGNIRIAKQSLQGVFKFEGVTFAYPKDKTNIILHNLNLMISKNHSGLMGQSGCGKSTILQLMMRFYDPDFGSITLDGINLKDLDLSWLRQQIGYVGQQPLLFSTSIKENLIIGKQDASQQQMFQALRQAEVLDFALGLTDKLETYVGNGGNQLSGGQKQRIAIARTLLKNPFIFFLDQSTSALDRRNQRLIQSTLSKIASQKRSITIAHRLRTLMNCQDVIVFEKGQIVEQGDVNKLKKFQNLRTQIQMIREEKWLEPQSRSKIAFQKLRHQMSQQTYTTLPTLQSQKYLLPDPIDACNNPPQSTVQNNSSSKIHSQFSIYAKESWLKIALGIISSIITGISVPSTGIHVARIVTFSQIYQSNPDYYNQEIKKQCFYMLITSIMGGIAVGVQYHVFLNFGCTIVNKIRLQVFHKIIKLPLSWFEAKENHAQQICIKLGADIFTVNHIISRYIPHFCGALTQVTFGLLTAFYFEWRTALMSIALIPLIGLVGIMQANIMSGYLNQSQGLHQQAAKMLTEAIANIKTVASFCYQNRIIHKYTTKLEQIQKKQFKKKIISGFVFGLTYFILFTIYGVLFYVSTIFIRNNNLDIANSFSAILLVLFSGIMAGNNIKYIPDLSLLSTIGRKLFTMIEQLDEDEIQARKASRPVQREIKGNIRFKNVWFKYQNREQPALKSVSFEIKEGQKIGIVGTSGCGKSTILKLLLGFYHCSKGEILIDQIPIEDHSIHSIRKHFGLIFQEPELFDDTVEYNIVYNKEGVARQQLYQAAGKSNLINPAATDNPQSIRFLHKQVGPRGTHLSGGQKQRVAIAQVLLRGSNILMLDEATSALDKQNESEVQYVLKEASKEKTTINVTHKLQQLQDSTKIIVLEGGEVIETGPYYDLIDKKENFYRLLHGINASESSN